MNLDKKSVTISVSQDPKTQNLVIAGDGPVSISGNGVVSYVLDDQTSLGLSWSGMSLRVNEPWYMGENLSAVLDPLNNTIVVSCIPNKGQPNPEWGAYRFYLTFEGSKDGVSGTQWSFDPEIDCEEPQ